MRSIFILLAFCTLCACSKPATGSNPGDTVSSLDIQGSGSDISSTDSKNSDIEAIKCLGKSDFHPCDNSDSCASGEYCDPCTFECKKSRKVCDPCLRDEECEGFLDGSICIPNPKGGSNCGKACASQPGSSVGCDKGYLCQKIGNASSNQCLPKVGSCDPGAGACKVDTDCPFQFICNTDYAQCVKGCTDDISCPHDSGGNPTVCSLGHCVTPCTGDGECAPLASEAKCVDSHCKIPGGCLSSLECQAKFHCNLGSHKCVQGCEVDFDCQDAALACSNSQCVPKGCAMNWECAFGQVCNTGSGKCEDADPKFCGPCDDKDDTVAACGGKPAICGKTKDNKGTEHGPYCFLPCTSDPAGACPSGYGCQDVKDDKGNPTGNKVCFRECSYTPGKTTP